MGIVLVKELKFFWTIVLFRRLFYFEKLSFIIVRTRFIEQSFSDEINQIDEKWTIILRTNETILLNKIERKWSVRNDERTNWKMSNAVLANYAQYSTIIHYNPCTIRCKFFFLIVKLKCVLDELNLLFNSKSKRKNRRLKCTVPVKQNGGLTLF